MKVHLKQIPPEGLHLEGDEDCPLEGLEEEDVRCAGPLRYKIDIGVSGSALWANGSLYQAAELRCVSCLEKFVYEIRVPEFAVHTELGDPRPSILRRSCARIFCSISRRIRVAIGMAIAFARQNKSQLWSNTRSVKRIGARSIN